MAHEDKTLNFAKIGERIREARDSQDKSQMTLAHDADISPAHLSHIENNHTKASLSVVVKLANTLKVSTDSLLVDSLVEPEHVCSVYDQKFSELLQDCTAEQANTIYICAKMIKDALIGNVE